MKLKRLYMKSTVITSCVNVGTPEFPIMVTRGVLTPSNLSNHQDIFLPTTPNSLQQSVPFPGDAYRTHVVPPAVPRTAEEIRQLRFRAYESPASGVPLEEPSGSLSTSLPISEVLPTFARPSIRISVPSDTLTVETGESFRQSLATSIPDEVVSRTITYVEHAFGDTAGLNLPAVMAEVRNSVVNLAPNADLAALEHLRATTWRGLRHTTTAPESLGVDPAVIINVNDTLFDLFNIFSSGDLSLLNHLLNTRSAPVFFGCIFLLRAIFAGVIFEGFFHGASFSDFRRSLSGAVRAVILFRSPMSRVPVSVEHVGRIERSLEAGRQINAGYFAGSTEWARTTLIRLRDNRFLGHWVTPTMLLAVTGGLYNAFGGYLPVTVQRFIQGSLRALNDIPSQILDASPVPLAPPTLSTPAPRAAPNSNVRPVRINNTWWANNMEEFVQYLEKMNFR